ncbi:MAG: type II/IV secretion system ATPase subunit [Candidatus Aenigmarchaeota archaeon]|nr:type II/IV secretion system ATPase subunit [Candidatus Aenigmarchaeota archaeon]
MVSFADFKFLKEVKSLKDIKNLFNKENERKYPKFFISEPAYLIELPKVKNARELNISYPLLQPLASANIRWDKEKKMLFYEIKEPKLTIVEKDILAKIKSDIVEMIDIDLTGLREKGKTIEYLEEKVNIIISDENMKLTNKQYINVMYFIFRDFVGLNEIEPMMHDPYIEDIGCNGINSPIFVVHKRFGSVETNITFKDIDLLNNFVVKLSERCGRYISYARPLLDGSLPDGSRVQASLAKDVTTKGPTFSIRRFRKYPLSPIELMNLGTASADVMSYMWLVMQAGVSILTCGGVSTGKTSLLNAITLFIPPGSKIVSIEDTRELNLPHENWIPAVSRTGFGVPDASGLRYGEVTLFELLKESFRQNPDYVIVGEVRGKEAYVMFQGMASGHPSIGTIHAGSVEDVIKRLETPPIEISPSLVESLDLLIVMIKSKERGESARRIKEVVEIQSVDSETGRAKTLKSFTWDPAADKFEDHKSESELLRKISFEKGMNYQKITEELQNRKKVLEWMQRHDVTKYDNVAEFIHMYYKDPETIMKWVKKDIHPYEAKTKSKKLRGFVTGLKSV